MPATQSIPANIMNRRKKVNQILKKRAKQKNEKLFGKSKPAYIPKAEREAAAQTSPASEPTLDGAS